TLGELSNFFNPGKYKHAILYTGLEKFGRIKLPTPMIMEAIGEGVLYRPLVECLATKDEICVLRLREPLTREELERGLKWALAQEGKPYDYRFDMVSRHKMSNL